MQSDWCKACRQPTLPCRRLTQPPTPHPSCRRMEEGAPTLLLSGAKQLLDLARAETSGAAEAYAMLAARVLSHGAGQLWG